MPTAQNTVVLISVYVITIFMYYCIVTIDNDSDDEKLHAKKSKLWKVRKAIDEVLSYIDFLEDQDVKHF